MMFIGREKQLDILNDQLTQVRQSGSGRFVWMRGRRRVGKSRLVEKFLATQQIPFVFYQAPRRPPELALERFSTVVACSNLPNAASFKGERSSGSWPTALQLAAAGATTSTPIAIVLDELPYLVEHDPGFPSDLQFAWDHHLSRQPVLLIAIEIGRAHV